MEVVNPNAAGIDIAFGNSKAFSSWCNLVPNNKVSGGKTISSHVSKRRNCVGLIFREAASGLINSKNELGNYYRRIRSRSGGKGAVIATAHKLSQIFFSKVETKQPYNPSKVSQ